MNFKVKKNGDTTIKLSGEEGGYLASALLIAANSSEVANLCPFISNLFQLLKLSYKYITDEDHYEASLQLLKDKLNEQNDLKSFIQDLTAELKEADELEASQQEQEDERKYN